MALLPDGVTVMELLVTVVGSMSSLITAVIRALSGTPVCVLLGLMLLTVVGVASEPEPVTKLA
jgi:hypothetical protein